MNTTPAASQPVSVRVEDLIAVNREIAALIRAGIPLEIGLRAFGGGLPSRLNRLADRIADRLSRGESPTTAFQLEGSAEFPVYSAVIDAGLQSGSLPEALDAVASSAELVQNTRRYLHLAMIYPIAVCVLGYLLFLFFVAEIVPRYIATAEDFGFGNDWAFEVLGRIHASSPYWMWQVPALVLLIAILVRFLPSRRGTFGSFSLAALLNRAQFAELLRMQVTHGLPMIPSFRRAADGTGDRGLRRVADAVCLDMESGVPFSDAVSRAHSLPPMMRWMLTTGARQGTLAISLSLLRDSFRRRAERRSYFLKVWFPVVFTVVFAGTFALLYGLIFFMPLRAFWDGVMRE
jgi:general secretion pathway protein F